MIWMVMAEILPDALCETDTRGVALAGTVAAAVMVLLQVALKV